MIEGRTVSAHEKRRRRHHRRRASRDHPAKERAVPVQWQRRRSAACWARSPRRQQEALREVRIQSGHRVPASSTTCSISPATRRRWASPIGADLREGKMTLPLIHLLAQDEEVGEAKSCATSSRAARRRTKQWPSLMQILHKHRSIDYAQRPRGRLRGAREERSRCLCSRQVRSATLCSRCRTTSCPGIGNGSS